MANTHLAHACAHVYAHVCTRVYAHAYAQPEDVRYCRGCVLFGGVKDLDPCTNSVTDKNPNCRLTMSAADTGSGRSYMAGRLGAASYQQSNSVLPSRHVGGYNLR